MFECVLVVCTAAHVCVRLSVYDCGCLLVRMWCWNSVCGYVRVHVYLCNGMCV